MCAGDDAQPIEQSEKYTEMLYTPQHSSRKKKQQHTHSIIGKYFSTEFPKTQTDPVNDELRAAIRNAINAMPLFPPYHSSAQGKIFSPSLSSFPFVPSDRLSCARINKQPNTQRPAARPGRAVWEAIRRCDNVKRFN